MTLWQQRQATHFMQQAESSMAVLQLLARSPAKNRAGRSMPAAAAVLPAW